MSIKPRTIADLGIEASTRYAKDKELFEPRLIEESKLVSGKTEVLVTKPAALSEFDRLFAMDKQAIWASFSPPPRVSGHTKLLFSFQLMPSIGGYEKQDTDVDRLAQLQDALERGRKKKKRSNQFGDQESEEEAEEEEEKQSLLSFFECLRQLDKNLSLINARRNQYQRG